ncbi:MAG: hypothetical protein WD771_01750 [Gemmatimonadaceae bacterium]
MAPAFPATALERRALALGWDRTRALADGAGRLRGSARLGVAGLNPDAGGDDIAPRDYFVVRGGVDVEAAIPVGTSRVVLRTIAASVGASGALSQGVPEQDAVYFGGPVTGPGYGFHSLAGESAVSQRVEWQSRIPFISLDLGRFGRVPSSLVVAPYVHGVWLDRPLRGSPGWHPAAGIATIGIFDLLRFDVSRGLRDGRWLFSVDVAREFWPVL